MNTSAAHRIVPVVVVFPLVASACIDPPEEYEDHRRSVAEEPAYVAVGPDSQPAEALGDTQDVSVEQHGEPLLGVDVSVKSEKSGVLFIDVYHGPELELPVTVVVNVAGDDGSQNQFSKVVGTVLLEKATGGAATLEFPMSDFGIDFKSGEFSGRLEANAAVTGLGDTASISASSEPLFFHMESNDYRVYDKHTLTTLMGSGDFGGKLASTDSVTTGRPFDRVVGQPASVSLGDVNGDGFDLAQTVAPHDDGDPVELYGSGASSTPSAYSEYTVCVQWRVTSKDSSIMFRTPPSTPLSLEEDWGATTGDDTNAGQGVRSGKFWKARNGGIRLCYLDPATQLCTGWGSQVYLNSNGCYTFGTYATGTRWMVEVQTQFEDADDNHWRVYEQLDGGGNPVCPPSNCNTAAPGDIYTGTTTVDFASSSTKTVYYTPSDYKVWNVAMFTGQSLYRLPSGLDDTEFNVCLDPGATSSQNSANNFSAERACFAIGDVGTQPYRKYLVAHEIGHGVGYIYASDNFNSATLNYDPEFDKDGKDNDPWVCDTSNTCTVSDYPTNNASSITWHIDIDGDKKSDSNECFAPCTNYNLNSYEWDSLALREAFAHTYATRVMNNRARDAIFTWNDTPLTLGLVRKSLDDDADELFSGGRRENVCCDTGYPSGCRSNTGTVRDWTGALWNWYASDFDEDCSTSGFVVTWQMVMDVFDDTLSRFTSSTQQNMGWTKFDEAVQNDTILHSCAKTAWTDQGLRFGID